MTKVLIVDDNKEFCELIEEFLAHDEKIEVAGVAYNGEEAISLLEKEKPDVILLDIIMPVLDGIGVLEYLQENSGEDEANTPKVIMLTAFGHEKITQKAVSMGADYYILKPFNLEVLAERIKQLHSGTLHQQTEASSTMVNLGKDHLERNAGGQSLTHVDKIALEQKISEILRKIGIPPHIKGYSYIRVAILIVVENPKMLDSVTKMLYPEIANLFQTTSSRVERAIRHAIEIAWNRNNQATIDHLFSHTIDSEKGKPTNSEMIALIADKIRLEYKQAHL